MDSVRKRMHGVGHALSSATGRIVIFLFIAMPVIFLCLMASGGYIMAYQAGWTYERGYDFMASATTGGAIVFPADPPQHRTSKVIASIAGASGVALFGFVVAALSSSAEPIKELLGLNKLGAGVYARLAFLAVFVVLCNLMSAMLLGWILGLMETWPFVAGFKTVVSVELGGGVVFDGQGSPHTGQGKVWFCVVGVWALGVSGLMIALAAGPATKSLEKLTGTKQHQGDTVTVPQALKTVAVIVFLGLPLALVTAMLFVAAVMASLTAWDFQSAFWAGLPAVSGGAASLGAGSRPAFSLTENLVLICCATVGFFLLTLAIGIGSKVIGPVVDATPLGQKRSVGHAAAALFGIAYIGIPIFVFLFAVPIGVFLAVADGWPIEDGFWWCVAVQLGGGMALTDRSVQGAPAMLIAVIAVAWSIGISILSVGMAGAPVVEPLIDALGMTLTPEELEGLEGLKRHASNVYGSKDHA